MSDKKLKYFYLPISLVFILCLSRLIPHPWNFTPILATGIFSGFYFKKFYLSSLIVLLPMFLGDLYLGFHNTMFFTYISLFAAVILGLVIKRFVFSDILFTGIISSICFFLITNFGAWLTLSMYEKNLAGLIESYTLAILFFHKTLVSTIIYLFLMKIILILFNKKNIIAEVNK